MKMTAILLQAAQYTITNMCYRVTCMNMKDMYMLWDNATTVEWYPIKATLLGN